MKKKDHGSKQSKKKLSTYRWVWWALLAIVLLSAAGMRYGLLDVPLERDEGEYAYAGQLILQGVPPYQHLYNMKLPGIYAAYAGVLAVFGQTHTGIHIGLLLINAATIVLMFLLGRRLFDPLTGIVTAASFAVLSISQSVQGVFANAEHFVILPAIGGLLLLLKARDDDKTWLLFCSGLLLGIGFLMKQHGAAFIIFGGLYLLIDQLRNRPVSLRRLTLICAVFITGAAVPYGLTCVILALAGTFENFWFWTVTYVLSYTSQVPIEQVWSILKNRAVYIGGAAPLIWTLVVVGLSALLWDKRARQRSTFTALFVLFSFVSMCPGLYFRPHYFVLILPAAALLTGIAISSMTNVLSNARTRIVRYGLPIIVALICLTVSIYQQRAFLFQMTPLQVCRATYGSNPFPESLEIGQFIREHTTENDRIAVIGSEPQIYFYSGRRSASGYIYMYPLMENHDFALQMQKEMIGEIELAKPSFLIVVGCSTSWLRGPSSKTLIFEWLRRYQHEHYIPVGLIEIFKNRAVYQWGPDMTWPPRTRSYIVVLKRKKCV